MSIHGYQPYKPSAQGRQVLEATKAILIDYEAWEHPMSVRQIFYRLIAEYGYAKTERAYQSLIGYVGRSRRAFQRAVIEYVDSNPREGVGKEATEHALADPILIPFQWVRDDRGHAHEVESYDYLEEFMGALEGWVDRLQKDRTAGQSRVIELWCEAGGMVPLMREIAQPFGVHVSSGGGYDSVTAKHNLAQRTASRYLREDISTTVLHVGDFDPSGEGMYDTLREDAGEMVWQLCGDRRAIQFERVALTEEQVMELEVETAPPKPTDTRRRKFIAAHPEIREHLGSDDITAQLEALRPPELIELIQDAIGDRLDRLALGLVEEDEVVLREEIRERLELPKTEED